MKHVSVEQYLSHNGCSVEMAYFETSALRIGYKFPLYGYRVTYRVEHSDFIICHLDSLNENGLPGNFIKLFNFLYDLATSVAQVSIVRVMIVDNIASPILQSIRHRLVKYLLAKGAFSKNIDGDDWLLFDVMS